MALRDIVLDGNSILRTKSREVQVFDEKLGKILDDMHETMIKADGCGLAGPQIGLLKRIAVIEVEGEYFEFVNPVIVSQKGSQVGPEGCLSVPGRSEDVKRPYEIKVRFNDRHGNLMEGVFKGFLAKVCCHEFDHLDGILYYDKAVKK